MKRLCDYRDEVLKEMVINKTLDYVDGEFYIAEGIKSQEIGEALIRRFSEKLNDALHESYSKAILHEANTEKIISEWVNDFADIVIDLCATFDIQFSKETIENKLRQNLDARYKQ